VAAVGVGAVAGVAAAVGVADWRSLRRMGGKILKNFNRLL